MKITKTTCIPYQETQEEDFKHPSKFYILNALGDAVYFHTSSRDKAQEEVDKEYGKGKYKVRLTKMSSGSEKITVRGSVNSKSRAGSNYKNICNRQGL